MIRENVLKVADAIESHSIPDLGFNMSWWRLRNAEPGDDKYGTKCATVACIGGWTTALFPGTSAMTTLGLTDCSAADLLYPVELTRYTASPAQAVAVLRHLAETGEVDWSVADTVTAKREAV